MAAFLKAGMGDPGADFGWQRGESVMVKQGREEGLFYVLDGVYPMRLGPGQDQGKALYLLGGHETFCISVDKPEDLVWEICEVVVKGLGSGQPRAVLAALVHLADCWLCMGALQAIAEALPPGPAGKPRTSDLFRALGDRLEEDESERVQRRLRHHWGRPRPTDA